MLEAILQSTMQRVTALRSSSAELRTAARQPSERRSLAAALAAPGLQVIAEIKRRSPSAGVIDGDLDAAAQAKRYAAGGAAAISVLTEPDHFGGSLDDLAAVRRAVDLPVLRKDFIVDELQILEAKVAGADAILLIVAALEQSRLGNLLTEAENLGLEAVVEAHDAAELAIANAVGAQLVGVNNRDLKTFVTDLATAEALAVAAGGKVKIAESGVASPQGAARMAAAGYDAILVGEALVRSADPARLIGELRAAGTS